MGCGSCSPAQAPAACAGDHLKEEGITSRHLLVCREPTRRVVEGIEVTPWEEFLDALWLGAAGERLLQDHPTV
ncbi:MAG: hypothetical protein OXG51_10950 [Gammaproteobacteria bacterium]|nr:hypothetical protein [Gammaproteobacteria bacterium]